MTRREGWDGGRNLSGFSRTIWPLEFVVGFVEAWRQVEQMYVEGAIGLRGRREKLRSGIERIAIVEMGSEGDWGGDGAWKLSFDALAKLEGEVLIEAWKLPWAQTSDFIFQLISRELELQREGRSGFSRIRGMRQSSG